MKNKEFPLSLIAQSMTPHAVKNHLLAGEEKSSLDNRASGRFTNSHEVSCARGTRMLSVFMNTSIHMCAITIIKLLLCKLTGTLIVHPVTRQTRNVDPMFVQSWATVHDAGPTLIQNSVNYLCVFGTTYFLETQERTGPVFSDKLRYIVGF